MTSAGIRDDERTRAEEERDEGAARGDCWRGKEEEDVTWSRLLRLGRRGRVRARAGVSKVE